MRFKSITCCHEKDNCGTDMSDRVTHSFNCSQSFSRPSVMNAKKQKSATKTKVRNYKSKKRQKYPKANNDISAQNKDMIEMPQKKEMPNMQQMPKSKRYDITLLAGWRESSSSGLIHGASHLRTKDHFGTVRMHKRRNALLVFKSVVYRSVAKIIIQLTLFPAPR